MAYRKSYGGSAKRYGAKRAPAKRKTSTRRSSPQTVRLVIEHVQGSAPVARPDLAGLSIASPTKKAKF